jgi:hypothetical protein
MPIADYAFSGRIFFARESGLISGEEAREWAQRLTEQAQASPEPIVALVDALAVTGLSASASKTFEAATFTENLIAVVVATNARASMSSRVIGLLGKRHGTIVVPTLEEARKLARELLEEAEAK